MELNETITQRASIRNFTDEPISLKDLKEMVRRAGLAPSINNSQPWKFYAITNQNILQAMAKAVQMKIDELFPDVSGKDANIKETINIFSTIFVKAPAIIAVAASSYEALSDKMLSNSNLTHDDLNVLRVYPDIQSVGASVQNLLLTAVDLGYGACWLSGMLVARDELQEILKIEAPYKLITFVAVGKTEKKPIPKQKKNVDEIFELIE